MAILPALVVWGSPDPAGPIELKLELSVDWTDALVAQVSPLVEDFAAVGELGGYCAVGATPTTSRLKLSGPAQVAGTWLSFPMHAEHVDARGYQLIRHTLSKPALEPAELRRIHVTQLGSPFQGHQQLPAIDDEGEALGYPQPAKLSFKLSWPDVQPSKSRRVLVEFDRVVVNSDFVLLRPVVARWGKLLEQCAFTLPYGLPSELDNVMGQTALFDAYTAEIEVPVHISSEESWNVLLNVLECVSVTTLRIVEVSIE